MALSACCCLACVSLCRCLASVAQHRPRTAILPEKNKTTIIKHKIFGVKGVAALTHNRYLKMLSWWLFGRAPTAVLAARSSNERSPKKQRDRFVVICLQGVLIFGPISAAAQIEESQKSSLSPVRRGTVLQKTQGSSLAYGCYEEDLRGWTVSEL